MHTLSFDPSFDPKYHKTTPTYSTQRTGNSVRFLNCCSILFETHTPIDISDHDFPGIYSIGEGFVGPRPTTKSHPHFKLDETIVSVPKVYPGDMVYWHCVRILHPHTTIKSDTHVRQYHLGSHPRCRGRTSRKWRFMRSVFPSYIYSNLLLWLTWLDQWIVMYIPAVPYTSQNAAYIKRQKESFLQGTPPPDFPAWKGEKGFTGVGTADDIISPIGRKAMGFTVEVA